MWFALLRIAYLLIGLWSAVWIIRTFNELRTSQRDTRTAIRDVEARLGALEKERDQRSIT